MRTSPTSHWEIATIVAICFGYYIGYSIEAVLTDFPRNNIAESSVQAMVLLDLILVTAALGVLR